MTTPSKAEARSLREIVECLASFDARNSIVHLREMARQTLATLPPQDSSDTWLLAERERVAQLREMSGENDLAAAYRRGDYDDILEKNRSIPQDSSGDARRALAGIMREYRHLMGEETPEIQDAEAALSRQDRPDLPSYDSEISDEYLDALQRRVDAGKPADFKLTPLASRSAPEVSHADIPAHRLDLLTREDRWVLVPCEPTEAMMRAAQSTNNSYTLDKWHAMVAAAPRAPSGEGVVDEVVNDIMDSFARMGGLLAIMESANYASRIRSTIWLHVNQALSPSSPTVSVETVSEILDRHIVLQEWPEGDGWQIVGLDQAAREIATRYAAIRDQAFEEAARAAESCAIDAPDVRGTPFKSSRISIAKAIRALKGAPPTESKS